jgi:methyl-accepting chemotaxis protein
MGVGDGAATLAVAVTDLKRALVQTVRTSTGEVNRRVHQRHDVDIPCRLTTKDSGVQAGHTINLSEGGAQVAGMEGLQPGGTGVLILDGIGLNLPVIVHEAHDTTVHLGFELDHTQAAEWRRLLNDVLSNKLAA